MQWVETGLWLMILFFGVSLVYNLVHVKHLLVRIITIIILKYRDKQPFNIYFEVKIHLTYNNLQRYSWRALKRYTIAELTVLMHKLKVTVERIDGYCNQPMLVGDHFFVDGGKLIIPDGRHMCMWALQSMMPIFPLLQRTQPEPGDWTGKSGMLFVCPDPNGLVHYRIERMAPDDRC